MPKGPQGFGVKLDDQVQPNKVFVVAVAPGSTALAALGENTKNMQLVRTQSR